MFAVIHKPGALFALFAGLLVTCLAIAAGTGEYVWTVIPFAGLLFFAGWDHKEMIFYLLLFSLPFSIEYNFSPGLGTDLPDELLMIFVSFLFLAYGLYSPTLLSKKIWQHPLIICLFILFGWMLVTVLFSSVQWVSLKFLLAKTWYIGAFVLAPLIVFRNKKGIVLALGLLTAAMMLVALIALVKHGADGFSFASINEAVSPFFRNHVNYSAMLVCILPLLTAGRSLCKPGILKTFLSLLIMIGLAALFLSYARGAWVALLAGLIAWWLIKKKLLFISLLTSIIILAVAAGWLKNNDRYLRYANDFSTTIFHKDFSEHLVATYKLKDVSTAERFYRWVAGVRMIGDNWLTGYGPGTFYNNYKPYAVPAFKTWVSDNKEHSTVHNYFLLTVIEQGLPGLFFLLLLLGIMIWYAEALYHRVSDIFYKKLAITTGVILSMILVVNFLSDLVETDKIGSLFFLCLALLIVTDLNTRNSEPPPDIQRIP
ncbi:MAG: O-antigen ligase family protein [Chitinophagaceae bacterium]